jgi:signal transduction histidine kinase
MNEHFSHIDQPILPQGQTHFFVASNIAPVSPTLASVAPSTECDLVQQTYGFMSDGRSGTTDTASASTIVARSTVDVSPLSATDLADATQAKRDANAAYERHLSQIGADLHDGPAQLLALALLHVDALHPTQSTAAAAIRDAVTDALRELRDISVGLVLPELNLKDAAMTARLAVDNYHRRTGQQVLIDDEGLTAHFNPPKDLKVCLYRVIQEGLQNGFKHATGSTQSVVLRIDPPASRDAIFGEQATLVIIVRDRKPDRPASCNAGGSIVYNSTSRGSTGIGLVGLKVRVGVLNGTLEINTTLLGTELIARISIPTNN